MCLVKGEGMQRGLGAAVRGGLSKIQKTKVQVGSIGIDYRC